MTSQKQISLFTEDQLTSLREVSHVNPTQPQESDLERKTNAIYGLRCLEQFEKFNHVGLWAKTFSGLLIGMEGWYSKRCKLTWKMKGTKYNRLYFQLFPSTHHTEETEFGLLLKTPTASDKNGGCTRSNPKMQYGSSLVNQIHGLTNGRPGKTSQLNTRFVMEMMGFPTDWTELPFLSGEANQSKQEETQ